MSGIWTEKQERFRSYIKALRKNNGLTQKELAERLQKPQSYISKYENGERRLDFLETLEVFEAFGIYDLTELTQEMRDDTVPATKKAPKK